MESLASVLSAPSEWQFLCAIVTICIIFLAIFLWFAYPSNTNANNDKGLVYRTPLPLGSISTDDIEYNREHHIGDSRGFKGAWHVHCQKKIRKELDFKNLIDVAGSARYIFFLRTDTVSIEADDRVYLSKLSDLKTKDITDISSFVSLSLQKEYVTQKQVSNVLNQELVWRTEECVFFSSAVADYILDISDVQIYPWSGRHTTIITPIKNSINTWKKKIPAIIHQTFETRVVPNCYSNAIASWLRKHPQLTYQYYDNADRRKLIKDNFDDSVLRAYDKLIPNAYKADLFRYCVLYVHGGIYIDVKMGAGLKSLSQLIGDEDELVLPTDILPGRIFNGIIASVPQHPVIREVIDIVIQNCENNYYGRDTLDPTGPGALGKALNQMLAIPIDSHPPQGLLDTYKLQCCCCSEGIPKLSEEQVSHIRIFSFDGHFPGRNGRFIDENGDIYAYFRHSSEVSDYSIASSASGRGHYSDSWKARKMYRD